MGHWWTNCFPLAPSLGTCYRCGHQVVVENSTQKFRKMKGTRCAGQVPLNLGHWWLEVLFQSPNIYQPFSLGFCVLSPVPIHSKHITQPTAGPRIDEHHSWGKRINGRYRVCSYLSLVLFILLLFLNFQPSARCPHWFAHLTNTCRRPPSCLGQTQWTKGCCLLCAWKSQEVPPLQITTQIKFESAWWWGGVSGRLFHRHHIWVRLERKAARQNKGIPVWGQTCLTQLGKF